MIGAHQLHASVSAPVALTKNQLARIKSYLGVSTIASGIDASIEGIRVQVGDRYFDYTADAFLRSGSPGVEYSVGIVDAVGDAVAQVNGLSTAMAGEIVRFPSGVEGLVMNLSADTAGIVLLDDPRSVRPGDEVRTTGNILSVPVGPELVGRVVSPLGVPIDGKGDIRSVRKNPLERIAPGVVARESVGVPLQTGIKAVDSMIPIGRGQRELIIGDRQTGKTSIALTTILNQVNTGVICVYVAIGQRLANIARIVSVLEEKKSMEHTIIVSASASDSPALQYLAPYAGCAIAEYFLDEGKDALVVYDDLSKHAWAYRQISLLLRRPSGREAYPGDIFYAHSRLLERACRLNQRHGGGSITALPIIETQAGDLSAYIPTNVISITDGQLYLESDLFNAGQRPAINVGNSVSRVGGAAQIKAMKQVAGRMRLDLAQFRELAAFAQFSSDLDEKTQAQLNRGQKMTELLKQSWDRPMPVERQVISIWAGTRGVLDDLSLDQVGVFEASLLGYVGRHDPELLTLLKKEQKISDDLEKRIERVVRDAKQMFREGQDGKQ